MEPHTPIPVPPTLDDVRTIIKDVYGAPSTIDYTPENGIMNKRIFRSRLATPDVALLKLALSSSESSSDDHSETENATSEGLEAAPSLPSSRSVARQGAANDALAHKSLITPGRGAESADPEPLPKRRTNIRNFKAKEQTSRPQAIYGHRYPCPASIDDVC